MSHALLVQGSCERVMGSTQLPATLSVLSSQLPLPSILDPPTKALSCIIPAYNEEDRLASTLDETLA